MIYGARGEAATDGVRRRAFALRPHSYKKAVPGNPGRPGIRGV